MSRSSHPRFSIAPLMMALFALPLAAAAIKAQMSELKSLYEARIAALEQRIMRAEAELARRTPVVFAPATSAAPVSNPAQALNAMNPSFSLVLLGNYAALGRDPDAYGVPGFALPDEAGPGVRGSSLGESELTMNANVDDKFYGSLTAALSLENDDTSIGLEEAWFQTLAMPYGLTLKGGRFFSRIGYFNEQHAHADDFVDRPLAYQVMLNGNLGDDGLQLRWLAPFDQFLEFGAEVYQRR